MILQEQTAGSWINISPPFSYEELEHISETLNVHIDFLTDSLDIDERSRFDWDDNVKLIVLNTPVINPSEDESAPLYITVPIGIILTPDYVITITSYDNPVLDRFTEDKVRNFNPEEQNLFVLQLFEQNVLRYLSCLKDLNVRRNAIEQELYTSSKNSELLRLLSIEKSFVYFVTALSSNQLLKVKIQRTDFLAIKDNEMKTELLEDIIIDITQAQEMAHIYSNILSGTMDAFASIISNNQNMFIQRLTIITIVLMVPTLVASFYGMNVHVPLQSYRYAFWVILAIAFFLVGILIFILRRNRML